MIQTIWKIHLILLSNALNVKKFGSKFQDVMASWHVEIDLSMKMIWMNAILKLILNINLKDLNLRLNGTK